MSGEAATRTDPPRSPVPSRPSRRYAPLDGVRAVAICTVLAFHTDGQWLRGGFLGVDVFFVLSGYLMIGILLPVSEGGLRMPATRFWLRRARRLSPALITMVVAVVAVSHFLSSPPPDLRTDVIAALAYVTNWWALANGSEYFDQWQTPSPLLQTWSLSIEEQFYLVLPLMLLLLMRLRISRRGLRVLFVVLSAASAVWAWHLQADPLRVYFGSDTRVQALFIGVVLGLLAPAPANAGGPAASTGRQAIGWISIGGLVALFFVAQPWTQSMPAWVLTVAALLTAGLLWALLESEHSALARVFAYRPLVWIGGLSYALYLWHWPVFLWIQARRDTALGAQVWAIVVSVGLAWLTTRFVERPIRGSRFASLSARRQWLTFVAAVGVSVLVASIPVGPVTQRGPDDSQWPAEQMVPQRLGLFGDSTAYTASAGFPRDRYSSVRYDALTPLGCGLRASNLQRADLDAAKVECDGWQQRWTERMDQSNPSATILMESVWEMYDVVEAGRSHAPGTPEYSRVVGDAVGQALDIIRPRDGGPVFVLGVPCHAATVEFYVPTLNDRTRQDALNAILRTEVAKRPQAHFIDLAPLTCSPSGPVNEVNGVQLRTDGVHWSEQGRPYLWAYILQQISDIRATQ